MTHEQRVRALPDGNLPPGIGAGPPPETSGGVRIRLLSCAVSVVVLVTGCEPRAEPEAGPADVAGGREVLADSSAEAFDSSAIEPIPDVPVATAPPKPTISGTDTGSLVTPLELATLRATLVVPVQGVTRSELRDSYTEPRGGRVHRAIDIPAPRGTPVLSATDGRLLRLFSSRAGGLMVYATDASERFILLYGHLDGYAHGLSHGMPLQRGQTIGYVGTTGNAPPGLPHLHFGILRGRPRVSWSRGSPVNPYLLLAPGTSAP